VEDEGSTAVCDEDAFDDFVDIPVGDPAGAVRDAVVPSSVLLSQKLECISTGIRGNSRIDNIVELQDRTARASARYHQRVFSVV
jgi:hypothetical protein